MLRKHNRKIASVIVVLTRQEGNTIVRVQQEQLAVTKMVNEEAKWLLKETKKQKEIWAMNLEDEALPCICRATRMQENPCYRPNCGDSQQKKAGNKGKSQRSFLEFHLGLSSLKLAANCSKVC